MIPLPEMHFFVLLIYSYCSYSSLKEFACGVKTICRGEKHQKNKTTDSNMKLLYLM